jgi:prepilin-type N-terminal cleavage/methylation domain-containing protein
MKHTAYLSNRQGLTLVELLIATMILGLLAEIMAHNLLSQMALRRLNAATRQLAWDLREARIQAVKSSQRIKVVFPDQHHYTIWIDSDNDGVIDANEFIAKSGDLQKKYHNVTFPIPLPQTFTFDSRGMCNLIQDINLQNSNIYKKISITISGKVKIL